MKKCYLPILSALPSILVGTLVMYLHGISATIYLRNLLFFTIGYALSILYMSREYNLTIKGICAIVILSVLFLCSPFLSAGIEGVHRWIQIGPISLNTAFIFLPILLIAINKLFEVGQSKVGYIVILAIAFILFLQPDASMLSAFSVALLPIFYSNHNSMFFRYGILVILLILSIISWWNIDNLQPVSYVEDIIVLAKESGWLYLHFSVISLFILLWPFAKIDRCQQRGVISISLGLFFLVLILSTLFGNFPVPLIGYGISPIIGYLISVAYVGKEKIHCAR